MPRKTFTERETRVLVSMKLLASFWQRCLPAESTSSDEIEHLLGLDAAGLVKARFDPPTRKRTGELSIARAVVLEVTAEGLSALVRARRQQPSLLEDMPVRKARRVRPSGASTDEAPGQPGLAGPGKMSNRW